MADGIEIKGGAGEFEAAVIAVVLDRIADEEKRAREARPDEPMTLLPAWVRAMHPEDPSKPRDAIRPA